jgi:hypothetical protein
MMLDLTWQQQRSTFSWERLDHASYSPNLEPSDFHFFPTLKTTLEGRRFIADEEVEAAVRTQDTDFSSS